MIWSITKSKIFSQCQRKWYYYEIMASPSKKDPLRREVYLLKQLHSVYAWRGKLVDTVIENLIIPRVRYNTIPSEEEAINYSVQLMEKQLEFGKAKKHQLPNIKKSRAGDAYCAFYELEYDGCLDEKQLEEAKQDVFSSLKNLLRSNLIKDISEKNLNIVAQRRFMFQFAGVHISCTPDMIVFFEDSPPLIIDWKVHSYAIAEYWLQLGIYGIALSKIKPHSDFPGDIQDQLDDPTYFSLIEYQLLKNRQRKYSISQEDIIGIEDYMFHSITEMSRVVNRKKYGELDIDQFQTAYSPNICTRCQFKKICWKEMSAQKNTSVQKTLMEVY